MPYSLNYLNYNGEIGESWIMDSVFEERGTQSRTDDKYQQK